MCDVLLEKHPLKQPPKKSTIAKPDTPVVEPHPVIFDEINGQMIRDTILRMDGAAGPSGLDAASWKCLCTSFKAASTDLCESLAATARRICTCYVDPRGLSSFVACRLIALDKCPGVRPIGIGETVRRIIGRATARVLSDDIQAAAGPLQLCAGHQSGCESAVHAMHQAFDSSETEAIILVDAKKCIQLSKPTSRSEKHPPLVSIIVQNSHQHLPRRRLIIHQWRDPAVAGKYHPRGSISYGDVHHSC